MFLNGSICINHALNVQTVVVRERFSVCPNSKLISDTSRVYARPLYAHLK